MQRDMNGIPILGTKSPEDVIEERLDAILEDKQALKPTDHDWVVRVHYGITNEDAERAGKAEALGIAADPPIAMMPQATCLTSLLCQRCEQGWQLEVVETDCPGMPIEQWVLGLPSKEREEVIAQFKAMNEDPEQVLTTDSGEQVTVAQQRIPDIGGRDL